MIGGRLRSREAARRLLERNGLTAADVDLFVADTENGFIAALVQLAGTAIGDTLFELRPAHVRNLRDTGHLGGPCHADF